MPQVFGEGGTVLIAGRKYDLGKVITASEQVADALAFRLGGGKALLTTNYAEYDRKIPWPAPGKQIARNFWLQASRWYEGVAESLVILAGPVTARWYALGRASVFHDGKRDMIVGIDGVPIASIDPEPCVVVYGEPNGGLTDAVDGSVRELCVRLGLGLWLANPGSAVVGLNVFGHVALLRFPYAVYGCGEGAVRIRCVPFTKEES
jgi:hypothetical protein